MNPWVTVETLTPDAMSVASVGTESRGFANAHRVVQRLLGRMPAAYGGINTEGVIRAINTARSHAENVDIGFTTKAGAYTLSAQPVLGPTGDAHAVRFWLGAAGDTPAPAPAFGIIWDRNTQTTRRPENPIPGMIADEDWPKLSLAEIFHRAVAFDRHDEVLDLLYHPQPGGRLQFELAMNHGDGRISQWRNTVRISTDAATPSVRWLIEGVMPPSTESVSRGIEQLGQREALRRAGIHLSLIQLRHTSISHWLTDPAPWIRWQRLCRATDVFHPRDRRILIDAGRNLETTETASVTVRTLDHRGGYMRTRLLLYPCAGHPHLAIGQLFEANEPDPTAEPHTNSERVSLAAGPGF